MDIIVLKQMHGLEPLQPSSVSVNHGLCSSHINAKVEVKPRSQQSMLFLTDTVHLSFYGALIPP